MQNLNDQPASSGSEAVPPRNDAPGAMAAQPTPFPKAGDATAAATGASDGPHAASSKRSIGDAHESVEDSANAGDDFVKRIVEGAHAAIDKLADAAGPTVDRIAQALSNPSGKASSLMGQAGDRKDAWISDVRDIVREHPIAAIAVALAAGAVYVKLTATPGREARDGLDD